MIVAMVAVATLAAFAHGTDQLLRWMVGHSQSHLEDTLRAFEASRR
jgi:hypothetical protein